MSAFLHAGVDIFLKYDHGSLDDFELIEQMSDTLAQVFRMLEEDGQECTLAEKSGKCRSRRHLRRQLPDPAPAPGSKWLTIEN